MIDEKFSEEVRKLLTVFSEKTGKTMEESYDFLLNRLKEVLEESE